LPEGLHMVSGGEKAYRVALLALRQKDYRTAAEEFEVAAPYFKEDKEFNILRETTLLLLAVKEELARPGNQDRLDIEEVFTSG
jgi:hypothetical protein